MLRQAPFIAIEGRFALTVQIQMGELERHCIPPSVVVEAKPPLTFCNLASFRCLETALPMFSGKEYIHQQNTEKPSIFHPDLVILIEKPVRLLFTVAHRRQVHKTDKAPDRIREIFAV